VDTTYLKRDPKSPTGIALITVAEDGGENSIVVVPGANDKLTPADVLAAEDLIASATTIVCSLEVPLKVVEMAVMLANRYDVRSIVNPAPAIVLPQILLKQISILTPNEHEVSILAGGAEQDPIEAAKLLLKMGAETVVVTFGSAGAIAVSQHNPESPMSVPAYPASNLVDTTGAGDCYTGALAVTLTEGLDLPSAMTFAAQAASISVSRKGAQPAMPTRAEMR
jgi:ribokinase